MTTANAILSTRSDETMALAQTYQQSMQGLTAIVEAQPAVNGIVTLQAGTLTTVHVQAGQHYKVRKLSKDASQLEVPDNVMAVRHGDALHLRYADGSTASFEDFYAVCTDSTTCSVNLASDNSSGITLSGADASNGPVSDDGLLVYAHGDNDVLMAMAQDQPGLSSAIRGLGDAAVLTYLPPDGHPGVLALLALGAIGAAGAASSGSTIAAAALSGGALAATQSTPLGTISAAAQNNTAKISDLAASTYAAAGVTGVDATNLASINNALDSVPVNGAATDELKEVQDIVNAYKAILQSADGVANNTQDGPTAAQYTAIGVTGVFGTPAADFGIFLLDNANDAKSRAGVDTVAEVQAMADAANHVIAGAAGGAGPTQSDLTALGVTGVTPTNLAAVQAAIAATKNDGFEVRTVALIQALVNATQTGVAAALNTIRDAAENNTATSSALGVGVYAAAGVSGVNAGNQAAINSALDSALVNGVAADTTPEVQAIVDAYNAILSSADGVAGNTVPPLTGPQYLQIGVTGMTGPGSTPEALTLLDSVVDGKPRTGVDTAAEVQALADAANHVIAAAGGTPAQIAQLTPADLTALGVTGVTTDNLPAVLAAIGATVPDTAIDTLGELQQIVTAAANSAANALITIRDAAENNTAEPTTPGLAVYAAAGVSGVTTADLASINSALDSVAVTGARADTTAEVQGIVNAYNAILASADGVAGNTTTALTGAQYTLVGVTGLSGVSAPGNALHLLDDVVDAIPVTGVDTVPELQTLADAAAHVISNAAGGTVPTLLELIALGVSGVSAANLAAVQTAIANTADDGTGVDTRGELQAIVNTAIATGQVPHITSNLGGVNNLEVMSNLVLNADQSVTVGTGFIRITDLGGPGYQGDTTTNTQTINVAEAIANHMLTITGTGANTHIVINPLWDLDLSSNYQLSFDSGVFLDAGGSHAAVAVAPINFSTVAPGTHALGTASSEARASQTMVDASGALAAGKNWLDIQGIGNNTGGVTQLGDLSSGAYALVMKNYATNRGGDPLLGGDGTDGIATHDTNIGVVNFGNNDVVYFDSQVNSSATQFFDARRTGMTDGREVGGLVGQNTLVMGLTNTPQQVGSTAMILLGLEGNTSNQIYSGIVTTNADSIGWANIWHNTNPPVIMG